MKYNLNIINNKLFTQQVEWLCGKKLDYIFGVQRSNFTNYIHCGQHWNVDLEFNNTYLNYLG
jgi:hypothetical protein